MRLISGTLCSTPLPWLPVLANIEPPALRRKAATDTLMEKVIAHGQFILISPTLCMPVFHPESFSGRIRYVWTSEINGKKTGRRLRWSTFP